MIKLVTYGETAAHETRVAITPQTVEKYTARGMMCHVEKDAGKEAGYSNQAYKAAGATLFEKGDLGPLVNADIVIAVQPQLRKGAIYSKNAAIIGLMHPGTNASPMHDFAAQKLQAFSLEFLPRITRAQSMDVLSSQSNLAGYKAVIDAVQVLDRAVPMMTTAAGSIKPVNALIIGAGVAGLQAIATAKRLGANVSAFDVRSAAKEQVESLGATFIEVANEENLETKDGYAKESSESYKKRQAEKLASILPNQDIIITTALIPGRPAPLIITQEMVSTLKKGAVIVDLAASAGGNVAGTVSDKMVKKSGITFIGHTNMAARLAQDASMLYANNVYAFIANLQDEESGKVQIDLEDEIISSTLLCQKGKLVHPQFAAPISVQKKNPAPRKKATISKKSSIAATKKKPANTTQKPAQKTTQKAAAKKPATRKTPANKTVSRQKPASKNTAWKRKVNHIVSDDTKS